MIKSYSRKEIICEIVNEINEACEAGLCWTALTSALLLPDLCSQNRNIGVGQRYKEWIKRYVTKHISIYYPKQKENDIVIETLCAILSSDAFFYQLRCAMVHEAYPMITLSKFAENIHNHWAKEDAEKKNGWGPTQNAMRNKYRF